MAPIKVKNPTILPQKPKPFTPVVPGTKTSYRSPLRPRGVYPSTETQFKPGNNKNPHGRPPRGCSIAEVLRKLGIEHVKLYDPIIMEQVVKPRVEHMLRGVYFEALYNHEAWAVNFIAERTEGKVKETVHQIIEDLTIDIEGDEDDIGRKPYSTDALDIYDEDGKQI